jgi:hypothetical protein
MGDERGDRMTFKITLLFAEERTLDRDPGFERRRRAEVQGPHGTADDPKFRI